MTRRIVGQCGQADFKEIEHLALTIKDPQLLDTNTLSNRQIFAFRFVSVAFKRKIPFKLLKVVKEVLFWGDGGEASAVEIKFFHIKDFRRDIEQFKRLW